MVVEENFYALFLFSLEKEVGTPTSTSKKLLIDESDSFKWPFTQTCIFLVKSFYADYIN
jgi:hypothetical protein